MRPEGEQRSERRTARKGLRRDGDDHARTLLERVIETRDITPVFQPLIDLFSLEVVGYEALSRGPAGPLASPAALFDAAALAGRLGALDAVCRSVAMDAARTARVRSPNTLFVNVEPETLDAAAAIGRDRVPVPDGMRVVFELTERALTARAADLVPAVNQLREQGFGIALDDVGVDRRSLALMPFLRPDVVKLDLALTQDGGSEALAEVHNAVSAYAEESGATVVAEGIETEQHARHARAIGATVGQGWLFGRPEPLAMADPGRAAPIPIDGRPVDGATSPFASVKSVRPTRRASKRLLLAISNELELQASRLGPGAVLLSSFQHHRFFDDRRRAQYRSLGKRLAFVGALGTDVETRPSDGVRGGALERDDPVVREWNVIVVGPHFAGALVAHDLGDEAVPDGNRRFDFALTHNRELVLGAARSLMGRISPEAP